MMHNSLLIRDLLRKTNNDPLHRERRDPHRLVGPFKTVPCGKGCVRLEGEWAIRCTSDIAGMSELKEDLADFLGKMGAQIASECDRRIELHLSGDVPPGGFRLLVTDGSIQLSGTGMQGLWAGVIYLEREMGIRRGPLLPAGETIKEPSWEVQISQAPWGANYLVPDLSPEYLSDDAFRLLAHYGVNGMTIYGDWLCYVRSEIFPELNYPEYDRNIQVLREATQRAAKYGISFYYVPVSPKLAADHPVFLHHPSVRGARLMDTLTGKRIHCLCSSDKESLAFHAEVMESLFQQVPLLGGLILIIGGESYYHCYMRPAGGARAGERSTNCPMCAHRPAEEIVADFVGNTADAVHRAKSDAWVLAWPYSATRWSSDPHQIGFIERMPTGAGLLSEIDKDQILQKEGYRKHIWDYSVDFTGPSDRIRALAKATRSQNRSLFIKTETALGLEMIHVPSVPCLHRLAQKWRNVAGLRPDGVLQAWMFFGMWGSRAEELGWWTSWRPETSIEDALRYIAERDFGPAANAVWASWQKMSDAISHLPHIPTYFCGPFFLGPAHPLISKKAQTIPSVFKGLLYYRQEIEETFSGARFDIYDSLVLDGLPEFPSSGFDCEENNAWPIFVGELERGVCESREALRLMADAEGLDLGEADKLRFHEERMLVEFIHRTWVTAMHTVKFLLLRDSPEPRSGEVRTVQMKRIAEAEWENAQAARAIYEESPWLDLALRVDGGFPSSKAMLEEKLRLLEQYLHREAQI